MTTRAAYVPDRGDYVWVNLNPRRGHDRRVADRPLG